VKPAGILLTPGTRTTRRMHTSFGHDVKQGPGATRASTVEWPNGERVSLQQNIGRYRRRRRCDGSDAERGKDEDAVQPSQAKRRRVNISASTTRRTAPIRQARLRCTNSSFHSVMVEGGQNAGINRD
jgi:hypothetical protein